MRTPFRGRAARVAGSLALVLATMLPAAGTSSAADSDLVLRVGTDQKLQVLNPFESVTVADFEVFTLNYDLLVNFGPNIDSVPGFAQSWTQSADGKQWTFKIRPGMKWSDGQPATSEDARWTYQTILDGIASERGYLGEGYLEAVPVGCRPEQGRGAGSPDARPDHGLRELGHPPGLRPDPAEAHLVEVLAGPDRRSGEGRLLQERAAGRRDRPLPGRRVEAGPVHPVRPQPELLGHPEGRRGRDHPHPVRGTRHDGPGAEDR